MIDLLRKYTPAYLATTDNVAWQVESVLAKVGLCRTESLLGRLYECPGCGRQSGVHNSCGERHCPQCSGARRADWTDRSGQLLLPGLNYFQVVFTLPGKLSRLVLGNRGPLYRLLFRSAWRAINRELRKQNIDPAALLVLHTWNQELGHHPHIHALVPGGGPSLNSDSDPCWVTARDVTRPWREKPSLVDHVTLGRAFRDAFVRGLGWLIRKGKLTLGDEWGQLEDPKVLRRWLGALRQTDWNVFVEGPPRGRSDPQDVLKYLARYLTGGPIADRRIASDEQGMVTFLARGHSKGKGRTDPPRPIKVPGAEFVRRWALHVLPKGFTRSRSYGGYHGRRREAYLEICRQLLPPSPEAAVEPEAEPPPAEEREQGTAAPLCSRCQLAMVCVADSPRPSWREVFRHDSERARPSAAQLAEGQSDGRLRPQLPRPET